MPLNPTENYLRDRRDHTVLNFADGVQTTTRYLPGPGNSGNNGYPMPAPGKIVRLYTWDGTNTRISTTQSSFNAGDRIALEALYIAPYFQINVKINGADSGTYVTQVAANATISASVLIRLDIY